MVAIPEGKNPPFIHSSGRIYIRQGGASDPIPENNRHAIDELYKKAKTYMNKLEEFRKLDFSFCKAEDEQPFLEIYGNIQPFKSVSIDNFYNEENLKYLKKHFNEPYKFTLQDISEEEFNINGNIEIDTVSTYHDSVSLRNLKASDTHLNGLTIEIDIFGNFKALIPLKWGTWSYLKLSNGYRDVISSLIGNVSQTSLKFIDGLQIFGVINASVNKYVSYLKYKGGFTNLEFKMRLKNCWQTSLYLDSPIFNANIENFGVPICMKGEQYFPENPLHWSLEYMIEDPIAISASMFTYIAFAFGVPFGVGTSSIVGKSSRSSDLT